MKRVFVLKHLEERQPDGFQGSKGIGTFSAREKAEEMMEKCKGLPGFRRFPDRWRIREVVVDQTDWANGFDYKTHERL